MLPQSITHKILARASGKSEVYSGEYIEVNVDMCFTHDPVLEQLQHIFYREFSRQAKVWDPEKIVLFQDHLVPAKDADCQRLAMAMDEFASEQNIERYYPYGPDYGICHLLMCEQGHVLPGSVILGTDSHTVTYGAFNAFASGIGLEDMVNVFRIGKIWLRVPEVIQIHIDGRLPRHVYAKDIILRVIADLGMAGASYKTIEFTGSTIEYLLAEERMTICNMTVEAGAKNGIMCLSESALNYLCQVTNASFEPVVTDDNFEYYRKIVYQAEDFKSVIACPHRPDNIRTIEDVKTDKIKVNQVYIGACTGGKIEDIQLATETLKGQKIAKGIRLIVVPGTMGVYRKMIEQGLVIHLIDSGAVIESPGCKACYGAHGGVLGDKEVCLSTANRNFKGRMGNPNAFVYLASPYIAAKTAIAGYITD